LVNGLALNWERYLISIGLHAIIFGLLGPIIGAAIFTFLSTSWAGYPTTLFDLNFLTLPILVIPAYLYGMNSALFAGCLVGISAGFVRSEALLGLLSMVVGATSFAGTIADLAQPPLNYAPAMWLMQAGLTLLLTGCGAGIVCALASRNVRKKLRRSRTNDAPSRISVEVLTQSDEIRRLG